MLSREQFDILDDLIEGDGLLSASFGDLMLELTDHGLICDGKITAEGLKAMEPYKVQRAVFIAAGFGSRLVPITLNTPKPLVRVHDVRIIDRLIDACLGAGIGEIVVVRGYLKEEFDQLLNKYPMVKFIDNDLYTEANNISSSLLAKDLLKNAYVFEADLLLSNPKIIKGYHYTSNFLGIKTDKTDDWCFKVENRVIVQELTSGAGEDIWQMVGISYWDSEAGAKLAEDIPSVYESEGGKQIYWEQVPLVFRKENYKVEVRDCKFEDIVEIDTFAELQAIDERYKV